MTEPTTAPEARKRPAWLTHNVKVLFGVSFAGASGVGSFSAPQAAGSGDYGDIAVGPTGSVMVTYQRPQGGSAAGKLYTALDPDGLGGGGFQAEATAVDLNIGAFYPIPAQSQRMIDAEAGLAWDRSGGAHNGRLYSPAKARLRPFPRNTQHM